MLGPGPKSRDLTIEQGYVAAQLTALSMLSYLKRERGDLDRISHWVRIFGMVNSAPGFIQQPAVINGFSDLILELWGPEAGAHARSAVGMAELPLESAAPHSRHPGTRFSGARHDPNG
jgi:YjgF/chorismate_mutase-like, putative endoribonuclease